MRSHDDDLTTTPATPLLHHHDPTAGLVTQRALTDQRPDTLDPGALKHLQRTAGNTSVASLLAEDEGHSPVLDVVGSGGGAALDRDTRTEMEASFGHDFSDVRIHTGAAATESARSVQAMAYTVGNDIVFAGDNYSPNTTAGKRTLAHELTHVVQQRSGPVDGTPTAGGVSVSDPSDRFERAAEMSADRIVSGGQASGHDGGGTSANVQRESESDTGCPDATCIQREEEELPEEEERAG
jgi:hypothetical protein